MIKLNICAARIPGMTQAQYRRYAIDNHARLVIDTEPVSRYLQAYIQQHVFDAAYGTAAPAWRYDSVSHIFAESVEQQMAATRQREYREIIAPDEPNFADSRSAMFIMFAEQPLELPTRGVSGYRLLHYAKRRDGVTPEALYKHWSAAHSTVLKKQPRLLASVRRAVLNKALPGPAGAPSYDGMCELGFVNREDVSAMTDYVARIEEQLGALIEKDRSFYLLAESFPVRGTLD